jgi:hypothetical protein
MAAIVIIIFALMTLAVLAWFLCEFKARRFRNEVIYLDNLIKRSPITAEAYTEINEAFNDLDCITTAEEKQKKSLWTGFQIKFYRISPYRIEK